MFYCTKRAPNFFYNGLDDNNQLIKGYVAAMDITVAKKIIQPHISVLISIKPIKRRAILLKRVSTLQLLKQSIQLLQLLNAALPINKALQILIKQAPPIFCFIWQHCLLGIESGQSFYTSLSKFSDLLPNDYLCFIQTGEQHGDMAKAITQANTLLTQKVNFTKTIKKAATYPAMILVVSMVIMSGMIFFLVPQFQTMYAQLGGALPTATQYLLKLVQYIKIIMPYTCLCLCFLIIIGSLILKHSPALRHHCQKQLFGIKGIRSILQHHNAVKWFILMGSLTSAGIPLIQALQNTYHAIPFSWVRLRMQHIIRKVQDGAQLSLAMMHEPWMNDEAINFIEIGEANGELAKSFSHYGTLKQQQATEKVDTIARLLEPLILVILAIVIGSILIVLYLPLFHLGEIF